MPQQLRIQVRRRMQAAGQAALPLFLICAPASFGQTTRVTGDQIRTITNAHSGSSYSVLPSDCGKLLTFSNATAMSISVPEAGSNGLIAGCRFEAQNAGAGTVTLTPSASTIDGAAAIALNTGEGVVLTSDGSNYHGQHGQASAAPVSATFTFQSDAAPIGAATALNISPGTGVSCTPQLAGSIVTLQCDADTAYLASKSNLQGASNPQICTSSSASGAAYTASCATSLGAYAARQTLYWFADVRNTVASPTLNLDLLGPKTLLRQDGGPIAVDEIKAQTLYRIWYDGANMRVAEVGTSGGGGAGLGDPGANGLVKRTATGVTSTAASGVDYAPATSGTSLLKGNGAGGFAAATITRAIGYTFDSGGAVLSAPVTRYLTVPFACTITGWNIAVDGGTATVKVLRKAAGSGVPAGTDPINTNGLSIATGTALHSSAVTDFTSTAIAANDVLGFTLSAANAVTVLNVVLECAQ